MKAAMHPQLSPEVSEPEPASEEQDRQSMLQKQLWNHLPSVLGGRWPQRASLQHQQQRAMGSRHPSVVPHHPGHPQGTKSQHTSGDTWAAWRS